MIYEDSYKQRLGQVLKDAESHRVSEARDVVRAGTVPPRGKELLMALVWQACIQQADGKPVDSKPLDRRELTDVIVITVGATLTCVLVGLRYTGLLAGVPSPLAPGSRARIFATIPGCDKKTAGGLRHVVVNTLQLWLHVLKANDTRVVTFRWFTPGHSDWEKARLAKEVAHLQGEIFVSETLRKSLFGDMQNCESVAPGFRHSFGKPVMKQDSKQYGRERYVIRIRHMNYTLKITFKDFLRNVVLHTVQPITAPPS